MLVNFDNLWLSFVSKIDNHIYSVAKADFLSRVPMPPTIKLDLKCRAQRILLDSFQTKVPPSSSIVIDKASHISSEVRFEFAEWDMGWWRKEHAEGFLRLRGLYDFYLLGGEVK
jgi:hypothetical protein